MTSIPDINSCTHLPRAEISSSVLLSHQSFINRPFSLSKKKKKTPKMPPGGIRSDWTGHIALDDVEHAPSGKVDDQGRVDVRFHDSPQILKAWCKQFQSKFGGDAADAPLSQAETTCGNAAPGVAALASPRLNIAIHVVGSRGDVQPFIPIAQMLSRPPFNHRVRICTHPVFKDFIEGQGIEFFSIGGDPEALMAYMVKNPSLLPSLKSVKDGDISKRRKEMWEIMHGAWRSCIEAGDGMAGAMKAANIQSPKDLFIADAIMANPPSMAHIHCAEKLGIPLHIVFTMPWSPTEIFSHPLAAMSYGDADAAVANYLSFMMLELLTWQG
jgi:sterol 3beta-glucosyltransferase